MPQMNGMETMERLEDKGNKIPVILIHGWQQEVLLKIAKERQLSFYMIVPIPMDLNFF